MKIKFPFIFFLLISAFWLSSCSSPLLAWNPDPVSDSSTVTITCNAEKGNQGLLNFEGPVYVHVGLITDSSRSANEWRYVRFKWGSADPEAEAKKVRKNRWSYTISNIRRFFGVKGNEKISGIAILFRAGNCFDTDCSVLRNENKSDMVIPVTHN
ncbi:MAG: hypothetical protein EKK37_11935 [Sphingobacteriales bacterium]|nr:MAG: hypothetical protein EKK37_11935 [Sphingobacteriales bacterium]